MSDKYKKYGIVSMSPKTRKTFARGLTQLNENGQVVGGFGFEVENDDFSNFYVGVGENPSIYKLVKIQKDGAYFNGDKILTEKDLSKINQIIPNVQGDISVSQQEISSIKINMRKIDENSKSINTMKVSFGDLETKVEHNTNEIDLLKKVQYNPTENGETTRKINELRDEVSKIGTKILNLSINGSGGGGSISSSAISSISDNSNAISNIKDKIKQLENTEQILDKNTTDSIKSIKDNIDDLQKKIDGIKNDKGSSSTNVDKQIKDMASNMDKMTEKIKSLGKTSSDSSGELMQVKLDIDTNEKNINVLRQEFSKLQSSGGSSKGGMDITVEKKNLNINGIGTNFTFYHFPNKLTLITFEEVKTKISNVSPTVVTGIPFSIASSYGATIQCTYLGLSSEGISCSYPMFGDITIKSLGSNVLMISHGMQEEDNRDLKDIKFSGSLWTKRY